MEELTYSYSQFLHYFCDILINSAKSNVSEYDPPRIFPPTVKFDAVKSFAPNIIKSHQESAVHLLERKIVCA